MADEVVTELTPQEMVDWANAALDREREQQEEIERLRAALERIASIANYTAPEDIAARLHNETQAYAIAREALEMEADRGAALQEIERLKKVSDSGVSNTETPISRRKSRCNCSDILLISRIYS